MDEDNRAWGQRLWCPINGMRYRTRWMTSTVTSEKCRKNHLYSVQLQCGNVVVYSNASFHRYTGRYDAPLIIILIIIIVAFSFALQKGYPAESPHILFRNEGHCPFKNGAWSLRRHLALNSSKQWLNAAFCEGSSSEITARPSHHCNYYRVQPAANTLMDSAPSTQRGSCVRYRFS